MGKAVKVILALVFLFASCENSDDVSRTVSQEEKAKTVVKFLEKQKFDMSNYSIKENTIRVEGDIVFDIEKSYSEIQKLPKRSKQRKNWSLVHEDYIGHITLNFSSNVPESWVEATREAIRRWNNIPLSSVHISETTNSDADILVRLGESENNVIAFALLPFNLTGRGKPGLSIAINTNYTDFGSENLFGYGDKVGTIMHEIGHTLGLTHTDSRNYELIFFSTDYHISGTAGSDPLSIMNAKHPDGAANHEFSFNDVKAAQILYGAPLFNIRYAITFNNGLITAFDNGRIYFSPDGKNLGGGGNTESVYSGGQQVTGMIAYKGGVITAFSSGRIYFSPDGKNLGGGGSTESVYSGGQQVTGMIAYKGGVITAFSSGRIYFSPDGKSLGGGSRSKAAPVFGDDDIGGSSASTVVVYSGTQFVRKILPYNNGVITQFSSNRAYFSPDGKNLGGGGSTQIFYGGNQEILAMTILSNKVMAAFSGGGIYFIQKNSSGSFYLSNIYIGQTVTGLTKFENGVVTAFYGKGIYKSANGYNPGGGGSTERVYNGDFTIRFLKTMNGHVYTQFSNKYIYESPDGKNIGGGGSTDKVYGYH